MKLSMNARIERARREVKARSTVRTAVLGDENQNIYSDRIGSYWARPVMSSDENGNTLLGPTFYLRANPAASILPRAGRKVFYKKDERGVSTITAADLDDYERQGIDSRAMEPNDAYRAFRYLNELVNLNSYAIGSGLLVSVREWQYHTSDNTIMIYQGTTASTHVDLQAYVPASVDEQCYALLVFNVTQHLAAANPLEVYASTPITTLGTSLSLADLQNCYDQLPTDEIVIPIKAYFLEYGQTEIAGISKDLDVRQFINVPSLGSSGAPIDAHYVTTQAETGLPNEFNLGGLTSGLLKQTVSTGVATPAIAVSGTDYTTPTGTENLSNKTITASSLIATALSLLIGGFKAIFTHANSADRTYTLPNYNATLSPMTTAGDLTYHTGTDNTRLAIGTALQQLRVNAGATAPEWFTPVGTAVTIDWRYFAYTGSTQTWTKPPGAVLVRVICIGGGGSGGSGRRGAAGSVRFGGGGGSPGDYTEEWYAASELGSTESIVIGVGGTGGAPTTTDNTSGTNTAGDGGATWFGSATLNGAKQTAAGGDGGLGGTITLGTGGIGNTSLSTRFQTYGANGGSGGGSLSGGNGQSPAKGPASGAGGAGITAGNATSSGQTGGSARQARYRPVRDGQGGAFGTNPGGNGGNGQDGVTDGTSPFLCGDGGGGGASNSGAPGGGAGGAGGAPGGGGGGGGASLNGNNSGAGGNGGNGGCYVITLCFS